MDRAKSINSIEVLFERLLLYFKPNTTESQTLDYLFIFEYIKVYMRIKEMVHKRPKMLKTTGTYGSQRLKVSMDRLDTSKLKAINETPDQIIPKIKETLQQLEKCKSIVVDASNSLYKGSERLFSSGVKVSFPEFVELLPKNKVGPSSLHYIAELTYTLRPLAYCYLLKFHGSSSLSPYVANLAIDALWLLLSYINYGHRVFKKKEVRHRVFGMLCAYLMRNPVFDNIVKKKVLFTLINMLIRNEKIRNFVLRIIDTHIPFSYTL